MDGNGKLIDAIGESADTVLRESKQPRFDPRVATEYYYNLIYNWIKQVEIKVPTYRPDSRERDKWLIAFSKQEPLLDGVIGTCVNIDQNRGWTLEGPARQVNKFSQILHNVEGGWRGLVMQSSSSYRRTDIGSIVEVDRMFNIIPGKPLPALSNLYTVDPGRVKLGKSGTIYYYPPGQNRQEWLSSDFIRAYDDVALDETYNKLGFCMVSRCIEIASLLIAVHEHEMERLLSRAPRGLLLLKNISQTQWNQAMSGSTENMSDYERQFYNLLAVLATEGPDQIGAELVQLSQVPDGFDKEKVLNMAMYSYALAAGYDPREFWPVSGGQLGTATETEVQHRKSSGKGAMNHILQLQEQLQLNLPPTVDFQFEQRDVEGERADVDLLLAKIDVIAKAAGIMTTIKSDRIELTDQSVPAGQDQTRAKDEKGNGAPGRTSPEDVAAKQNETPGVVMTSGTESALSREEVRILMADAGFIPREWTEYEEQISVSDKTDEPETEELRWKSTIRAAAERFPTEPIIRYSWPSRRIKILFEEGQNVFTKRYY